MPEQYHASVILISAAMKISTISGLHYFLITVQMENI